VQFRVGIRSNDTANGHEEAKSRTGTGHVLSEGPHDAVRASAVSEDVDGSKDKAHDDTDSSTHHGTHLKLIGCGGAVLANVHRSDRRHVEDVSSVYGVSVLESAAVS
jgi:hypothetical protein